MRWYRLPLALVFGAFTACWLTCGSALGQEAAPAAAQPEYRWLLSGSFGTTSSGPADDVERAMTAAGFNHPGPGIGEPLGYPFSRTGFGEIGSPWMLAAHRAVAPKLLVGVTVSDAAIGATYGNHDPALSLELRYYVRTVAPTVSYRIADNFHVGAGPAFYSAKIEQIGGGTNGVSTAIFTQSATKVGALLDLGWSLPASSRFCVMLSLQYRWVGRVTIGPFESTWLGSSATMPASSVSYDHVFFGVGFGARL